jgi:hypothetical protein
MKQRSKALRRRPNHGIKPRLGKRGRKFRTGIKK